MSRQPPVAVRALAAAFAAVMTAAILDAVVSIAEPQQSRLMAATAARQAERTASAPQRGAVRLAHAGATTSR